jgi:hypothetical protein
MKFYNTQVVCEGMYDTIEGFERLLYIKKIMDGMRISVHWPSPFS